MAFRFEDNSTVVLAQLSSNAQSAMKKMEDVLVEAVQNKMLYGYHTPHGPDGHTEIVDTGKLFDSIEARAEKQSQNLYTTAVGTNVPYAVYVHDGTYKLAGRPFIKDGVNDAQADIQQIMETNLKQGF